MNDDLKIIREVNAQAELFYERAKELGDHAASVLKENHRSQMTSLENIAESALKTSDIFDYIKKQTARFPFWREGWSKQPDPQAAQQRYSGQTGPEEMFGKRLLTYLEDGLSDRCRGICKRLNYGEKTDDGQQKRRRIYLLLIRQFIRQMVVQYEYKVSKAEGVEHASQP
jgi:hypothetical protein